MILAQKNLQKYIIKNTHARTKYLIYFMTKLLGVLIKKFPMTSISRTCIIDHLLCLTALYGMEGGV